MANSKGIPFAQIRVLYSNIQAYLLSAINFESKTT